MKFTDQEMMFLISVSRGRVPFGIDCRMPETEKKEEYIRETLDSLKKKGILNEKEKLTKEGAQVIYLFEQYRNCKKHIRLNHVNIAVLAEEVLAVMIKTQEGYETSYISTALFMTELLKHADYLCHGEEKSRRGKWESVKKEEWLSGLEEVDGCLLLWEYNAGRLETEKIYYWKDGEGYLYNRTRERRRSLSPGVMRKQIYRTLGGEGNG